MSVSRQSDIDTDIDLGACMICGSDQLTIIANRPTKTNPHPRDPTVIFCCDCRNRFPVGNWCPTREQIIERAIEARLACVHSGRDQQWADWKQGREEFGDECNEFDD